MAASKVHIGTSGWKYAHWENTFYPADLKKKDQLQYLSEQFGTVEINNSFYRQPKEENFRSWKESVPADFLFSVKANRYFTHLKKLMTDATDIHNFLAACNVLEQTLGPILFQLPPKWKLNLDRLSRFLAFLPKGNRYAFEFRESSWYSEAVYDLLRLHNCAFCIYHLAGHQSPLVTTADFVYLRLHGPGEKYQGSYNQSQLSYWCGCCKTWLNEDKEVFVYFDNDQNGFAPINATALKKIILSS